MKINRKIILFILMIVATCIFASSCKADVDPDFVEVSGIRVPCADVFLSPSGETSTFQLEPTIVPQDATNRLIYYYIQPENLQYLSVDTNGLILAKKTTEEGQKIPIKIYSASNNEAYTYVYAVIEFVEVEEINFESSSIKITYPSEKVKLNPIFSPYHAQDGRSLTYKVSAIGESPLSVDIDGFMTIKGVGIATVFVEGSTLSGKKIKGHIQITVAYPEGRYRLDVPDSNPKYEQVVGSPERISFNIIRPNNECDQKPTIQWRVKDNRISSNDGEWDFEYMPETDSTPCSFYVTAEITPKGEQTIVLTSKRITLRRPFSQWSLETDEIEGNKYNYGEEGIFQFLEANAETIEWYIKRNGESGYGKLLDSINIENNNGDLHYVFNADGDFVLTALGKNAETVLSSKEFEFSVIKYVVDDYIQINPIIGMEEKTPESFDWYLYNYDKNIVSDNVVDHITSSGQKISTTCKDETLNYLAQQQGSYIIGCTATINGLILCDTINGESVVRIVYSKPFEVFENDGNSKIFDIDIDGICSSDGTNALIKWNKVGGINSYIVELSIGDKIYLFDSERLNEGYDIEFRDYSIILPNSIATLDKDFSIRVKQKGSSFSEVFDYEKNTIKPLYYPYLEEIYTDINYYISDIKELGDLINYTAKFKPLSLLKNKSKNTYEIKFYTALKYEDLDENLYPVLGESSLDDENLINIYNLISCAYNVFCSDRIESFATTYYPDDKSYGVVFTLTEEKECIYQEGKGLNNLKFENNYAGENRGEDFDNLFIDIKNGINVTTSTQLYYAAEQGKRPFPMTDTDAEIIYNEAKRVLNSILSEDMTDFQRVLAIYDYLCSEIEYDNVLEQYSKLDPTPENLYRYDGFQLEGVFLHKKAVCEGISKAFNLLCWMEGIQAQKINGKVNNTGHSWNKVLVEGKWYNVDATWGRIQSEEGSFVSYKYFLVSDIVMENTDHFAYGENYPESELNYGTNNLIKGKYFIDSFATFETIMNNYILDLDENEFIFEINVSYLLTHDSDAETLIKGYLEAIQGNFNYRNPLVIDENYLAIIISLPN